MAVPAGTLGNAGGPTSGYTANFWATKTPPTADSSTISSFVPEFRNFPVKSASVRPANGFRVLS